MKDTNSPFALDKRVVERNIKKGLLTREAYDKHLASLPDVADHSEVVKARLGEEDEPDDEDFADEEDEEGDEGGEEAGDDEG